MRSWGFKNGALCGRRPRNGTRVRRTGMTRKEKEKISDLEKISEMLDEAPRRLVELSRRNARSATFSRCSPVCILAGLPRAGRFSESYLRSYCCPGGEWPARWRRWWYRMIPRAERFFRENFLPKHARIFSPGGDSDVFLIRDVLPCRTRFPGNFFWMGSSFVKWISIPT